MSRDTPRNGVSCSPTMTSVGQPTVASSASWSGWSRIARPSVAHITGGERRPLAVVELLVAGPLREHPLVRGRAERLERVHDPLELVHPVGERDHRAELDDLAVECRGPARATCP